MQLRERFGLPPSRLAQEARALSTELVEARQGNGMAIVRESMMMALALAYEDRPWIRTDGYARDDWGTHLSLKAIQTAGSESMALIQANPVMASAANSKVSYVLGNGVRIKGNAAVTRLMDEKRIRNAVFSVEAREQMLLLKMAMGNVLLHCQAGSDNITRIPFEEICGAVYDKDDPTIIQYFYRKWMEKTTDPEGVTSTVERKRLYPNSTYETGGVSLPESINGVTVDSDPVLHIYGKRYGGAWGVPDLLAGIFYATEHKELVEAGDAIYRAQSQYAIQYKTKTKQAFEKIAVSLAMPANVDPRTGEPSEFGNAAVFGQDIEMQLMNKIGAGIDFGSFDPIAALAIAGLGIPVNVVNGKEEPGKELPFSTLQKMKLEQQYWADVYADIFEMFGIKRSKVRVFFPPIQPDPTHRQVQSIVGAAKTKVITPQQTYELFRDTFGADWDDKVGDPKLWDDFGEQKLAPGAVEGPGQPITPGQGQTGKLGKLADGDHELRDEGGQAHTE